MEDIKINSDYIVNCLQQIVNSQHVDPIKKHVKIKHDGNSFAISCVYCGDSEKNARNYRGNLNSLLFYRCFNCGIQTHFTAMCRDFGISISTDVKLKIYEYLDKQTTFKNYKEDFSEVNVKNLINLNDLQTAINENKCKLPLLNFKPIVKDSLQHYYLNLRGIPDILQKNIWQADLYTGIDRTEPVIVNLNKKDNSLLGIQTRNLKEGKFRKFHIFNFQDLHEALLDGESTISDGEMVVYNKLSYFYNILNINFEKKITLFEGYLDSLFYPNAVGLVGTNTDTSFFENNELDVQFFYDNDTTGFNKSNDKIKDGYSVFLWNKLFKNIVDTKKVDDPYQLEYRIKKVKDLNKLAKFAPDPFNKFKLPDFFSRDSYDKIFLPPKTKTFKPKNIFKRNIY